MKKYQKKVKHGMRRQLTDREEHGQPSSVLPNICWRDDSPIFEWSVIPEVQFYIYRGLYEPDLELNRCPCVEIDRFNLADVCAHGPVYTGAPDAQKDAAEERVLGRSYFH